ncbi:uncharacterized protein LOC126234935, partial [Schistocerca nitens]|uniref:uncharacterized protein LOC126234935 n=1 Tax=Schistocerca nitens TaxID=7011 RepID=UPI0021175B51
CDCRMKDNLKSKIYRTVIRPVALYGCECWLTTVETEHRLSVMETKMLRWTVGLTKLDHISNDSLRKQFGVALIQDNMRESRLRWFGHVLQASDYSIAKAGYTLEVVGSRPKGRSKQRWADTIHKDLKCVNIHPDATCDRAKWRQRTHVVDPEGTWDKR